MRVRTAIGVATALAAILAVSALAEKKEGASSSKGETKPVATLGNPTNAKWSSTTYEAASAEANKKVLETGKPATITGEVVDVSCYLQLGKRGEAHVACGTKCITNGQPIGIVDHAGNLYLVMAEEHHPRRDGETDLKTAFLPYLAKTVTVTGVMTQAKGYRALFVRAGDVGALSVPTKP
jgi:uncharacterized Zn-binding protein involved in type VI secretion